ncbi:MAG: SusD/RagB family nutrient-binding outer membrane lipoprotein [Tannerella forsythia]|uniref:SusD/RagB family nutrient-binding outer membrane lipoprotein n=1 Tax=Tannerella forsythia TaxID=28112 RepID=UPI00361AF8AB
MKTINKFNLKNGVLAAAVMVFGATACTSNFEELNTDPTGLTSLQAQQVGSFMQEAQRSIYYNQTNGNWEYQLIQNLNADLYSGYLAIPTPFASNNNNSQYVMMDGWNNQGFKDYFLHVMKPCAALLETQTADDYVAITKILRVAGMSKAVDTYGPIPYSKAIKGGIFIEYDSEEAIYKSFFEDLADAIQRLTAFVRKNGDVTGRLNFDLMCGKSHTTWLQFANTLRLRLAMRVVKVAPDLAKKEAEAAVANPYGVLEKVNIEVKDENTRNPLMVICRDYNDCSIGASFESILKGYKDPRLVKMALPVGWMDKGDIKDQSGKETNSIGKIYGVRNGFEVPAAGEYKMYSIPMVNTDGKDPMSTDYPLPIMKRAESYFLRAEGALRGWAMKGTAEDFYKEGVRVSFDDYKVSADYNAYIEGTTMAADYIDPHNPALNMKGMNDVPVKFMTDGTNEQKLQQIITQKWIAGFLEGLNAWSEYRRTGYPKLFPIIANKSAFPELTTLGIRRLPFCQNEKSFNRPGYDSGVKILEARGGKDNIATRLWWDTPAGNF